MTITQANAVAVLTHFLLRTPTGAGRAPSPEQVREALDLLHRYASKALQIDVAPRDVDRRWAALVDQVVPPTCIDAVVVGDVL